MKSAGRVKDDKGYFFLGRPFHFAIFKIKNEKKKNSKSQNNNVLENIQSQSKSFLLMF